MSIRATSRLTGSSLGIVLRLLAEVGEFCEVSSDFRLRNLTTTRVEAIEQWSFVGAKPRNAEQAGHSDLWTYCAMDSDSKLVFSWLVGPRDFKSTQLFMDDVASRLTNRVQPTTDGYGNYVPAVRQAFKVARLDVNHAHAVALNFFVHNFVRPHATLTKAAGSKTTPAMAAGLTDRPWTLEDLLAMMSPDKLLQ